MNSEPPKPRSKTAAYFRIGTKSPKKRCSIRPPVEKRKINFKKGISTRENRKRRSSLNLHVREKKKNKLLEKFRADLAKNTGKKYTGSTREKLVAFYKDRNPEKVVNVDATLAKYAGNDEKLFIQLAKRYEVNVAVFGVPATVTASCGGGDKNYGGAAKCTSVIGDVGKTPESCLGSEEMHRCNTTPAAFGVRGPSTPFAGNFGPTFGSLISPKSKSSGFASGSLRSSSKGRKSITSLKTFTEDLRLSSDEESIMECD